MISVISNGELNLGSVSQWEIAQVPDTKSGMESPDQYPEPSW